ncbi:MAG: RNA polymerase factor sigma-54 [Candidatus Omnitrophota bacterium]
MKTLKISHKLSQRLLITPQLKQALYLLQLPLPALRKYIEQKLSENPLLQPPDKEPLDAKIKKILDSNINYLDIGKSDSNYTNVQIQPIEKQKPDSPNLQDYLLHQLRMTFLNDDELVIAEEIIANIDDNGYLKAPLDKLAEDIKSPLDKIEKVLHVIQALDPPGIGARDLQECLLIQLRNNQREESLAFNIVKSYFKELGRKKYQIISKKLNIDIDKIKSAIREITSLNPKPGAAFSNNENIDIIPDIIVKPYKNRFRIMFNKKWQPKLKINPQHRKILKDPTASEDVKQFINERLKNALWLIKSVAERQKNILRVTDAIVKIQRYAILNDLSYVRPLTLKDIADRTHLHLSTVARIVANKYIATPQRTFCLKDLFGRLIKSDRTVPVSNKYILSKIQNIILLENKGKPITDQTISNILSKKGIKISRRTIAKYRDKLKILPSYLR